MHDHYRSALIYSEMSRFTAQVLHSKNYASSCLRQQSLTPPDIALSQITDQFVLGGLCDDDLEDTCPAMVEQSQQDITSCRNEVFPPSYWNSKL